MEKKSGLPVESPCYLTLDGESVCFEEVSVCGDLLILHACQRALVFLKDNFDGQTAAWFLCEGKWTETSVEKLPQKSEAYFVQHTGFLSKKRFYYDDLVDIIKFLRSPKGCPWDRALTLAEIRTNIIEEAYELVDAIESADAEKIAEETGDLLMQSVFVNLISVDKGFFDTNRVYDVLCKKLISRHTHIFGADSASDGKAALEVWEANKKKEKKFATHTQDLNDVPKGMPSLMRAQKIGKRAAKAGFDFCNAADVVEKCLEEIKEVLVELKADSSKGQIDEIGDLLFSVVNLCRFLNINSEVALTQSTNKFVKRFEYVEQRLASLGKTFEDADSALTCELWDQAKEVLCERD